MSKNPRPILAVNSGSSTLKFGLFAADGGEERTLVKGGADGIGKDAGTLEILDADDKTLLSTSKKFASQTDALSHITSSLKSLGFPEPVAVGHRIVHGGPRLRDHTRITPDTLVTLEASVHFAPVHIPTAVALIRGTEEIFPIFRNSRVSTRPSTKRCRKRPIIIRCPPSILSKACSDMDFMVCRMPRSCISSAWN